MKTYDESLKIIFDAVQRLSKTNIPIDRCSNHIVAEDIKSSIDVAPFRNSAMDGFAVRFKDITSIPITLPICGSSFAGHPDRNTFQTRHALKIMTGAPVPDEYDTVVRFEDTTYTDAEVTINEKIIKGQYIRHPGEDIKKGDVILKKGEIIRPLFTGAIASMGLDAVSVYNKPKVLVISIGDELVEPGQSLKFGQLYNSNRYTIGSMIQPFCQSIKSLSIVKDRLEDIASALQGNYDVIITSGSVSTGDKDYVPQAAEKNGWVPVLYKVAIRPGKPIYFARKNNQFLFGLPGNPLSTAVTCACFVIPALKKMSGSNNYFTKTCQASLTTGASFKSGRTIIWPAIITGDNNNYIATFASKRSSAALSALLNTDGLIIQHQTDNNTHSIEVAFWNQILNY